jgi:formylglycine-generating enzyme required for sulfatase activity
MISATPISNKQYREFVAAVGFPPSPLADDLVFGGEDQPVVGITKSEAVEYSTWAGGRLPTEAEWECAARGARKFAEYPWGDEPPVPTQSNIDGVWKATSHVMAHPMGKNDFGLWDMCGNVWEWCSDTFDPEFYGTLESDILNPISDCENRPQVIRGGSFQSFAEMGRCAFRGSADAAERRSDIGFRIVYDD